MSTRHVRQQRDERQVGVTRPAAAAAALCGMILPIPAGGGAGDDFEARVRRAWEHLKAGYFAAAEHDRLRAALRDVLDLEWKSNG